MRVLLFLYTEISYQIERGCIIRIIKVVNSVRVRLVTCLILCVFFPTFVFALPVTTEEHRQAIVIQEAIFNGEYTRATKILEGLKLDPYSPLPTLVRMTIIQMVMSEDLKFSREAEFFRESEINGIICDKIVPDPNTDVWHLMLCGASEAMRSFYYLKKDKTLKAIHHAGRSLIILETAKKKDPDNIDVELGPALYDFFKSQFIETKLAFVPFLKDRREESLQTIYKVSLRGVFARNLADFSLGLIALDTNRKDIAERIFPKMLKKFPNGMVVKIMFAAFLIKSQEYQRAMQTLESMEKTHPEHVITKYFMGRALTLEGKDLGRAKMHLEEYLKTGPDPDTKGHTYYLLGLIAEKQGRIEDALALYQRAYDLYPRYKEPLRRLVRLKK
ncbi:MAG: tetratricopeptide repeat protein [Deltaproteobacteria bacterium]|nr:tetratricopeptide repeat protein [Deltaproteobacteria bacterium]